MLFIIESTYIHLMVYGRFLSPVSGGCGVHIWCFVTAWPYISIHMHSCIAEIYEVQYTSFTGCEIVESSWYMLSTFIGYCVGMLEYSRVEILLDFILQLIVLAFVSVLGHKPFLLYRSEQIHSRQINYARKLWQDLQTFIVQLTDQILLAFASFFYKVEDVSSLNVYQRRQFAQLCGNCLVLLATLCLEHTIVGSNTYCGSIFIFYGFYISRE